MARSIAASQSSAFASTSRSTGRMRPSSDTSRTRRTIRSFASTGALWPCARSSFSRSTTLKHSRRTPRTSTRPSP
eukprot:3485607-Lingulodinium_polyedra.AAC.1